MPPFVFCSHNRHKLEEVIRIMGEGFQFKTLSDIDFHADIPEPFETLEENSLTKAMTIHQGCGLDCFAEDTGLFVEALHGEPGVRSARYAGEGATSAENIAKLMHALEGREDRSAYFKTVLTYIHQGEIHQFEGLCHGHIAHQISGKQGFGYDPVFIPEGYHVTFAEMQSSEKDVISHRKKAFDAFSRFLKSMK
ncbi:MAG: RdgB/HAM1 family non-canonical purine NTP pyrophosphatase [Chitinophagaceae bacterium]|nr:RdgB/HAM1 family non-canonical purine NTP pyrophosphatase [Chitinophagaceae bacterium]